MTEPDPLAVLLKDLDQPATPRPEFAAALRTRVLAELTDPAGPRKRRRVPHLRPAGLARHWRPVLAGALACAVAATAIVAVVLSRPAPASALDVILAARKAFATAPPFEATLRVALNPDGSNPDHLVTKGATATVAVSYGGPKRFRIEIVAEQPRLRSEDLGPGSYEVYDGRRIGSFDAGRKIFSSTAVAPDGFSPLEYLSWHGAYPDWQRICRYPGSKVLPDARIAGRVARHVVCRAYTGDTWQLWIDQKTGLLLKVVGQVGGGDLFTGGPGTSAQGGFQVVKLRYDPSFPAGTFTVAAPPGALDYQGRLQAAEAGVPPFRAVVYGKAYGRAYTAEMWYRSSRRWRIKTLAGRPPLPVRGGAGSFAVAARGTVTYYKAAENSYGTASPSASPLDQLVPVGVYGYSAAACPAVGHERIAGRDAVHRHCASTDVWVDRSTGLILRQQAPRYEFRVRSIDYRPVFPPGTFRFAAPPGARSEQQLENDPYYKTTLAPGKPAPPWQATSLGGGTFRLTGLRGKPALLLLFADTCPAGDRACDVFTSLEQVYKEAKGKVAILWVDLQGRAEQAQKIVAYNHLTFPVVVDTPGASIKAWKIQAYPYWLLLDSRGRVIEARLKPQTITQLQQLLAKAR